MGDKNITMLSHKGLRVAIKNNATVKSLCSDYCTEKNELLARIESLYRSNPKEAKKIIASLYANEDKAMKKFRHSSTGGGGGVTETSKAIDSSMPAENEVPEPVSSELDNIAETPASFDTMESLPNEESNSTETPMYCDTMKPLPIEESNAAEAPMCLDTMRHAPDTALLTESLEELKKLEEAMATAVTNSENLHKLYATKHRKVREEFTRISEEVGEYRRALAACKAKFEELFKEEVEISQEIQTVYGRIVSERNYLEKIRSRIRELQRIEVFAYNSGEITVEKDGVVPDESGYEEIFDQLIHNDACSELRAREIKLLARVMAVVKNIDGDTYVVFEATEIEPVFNLIKA